MLVAVPVVLGVVSYFELGVDLFPKVDFPVVSVTATLPGTSPEEMETSVTKPIEEAVNTVSGVDELRSTTREGMTSIVVQFVLEKNGDVAAQEVRDKISSIMRQLPDGHGAARGRQVRSRRRADHDHRRLRPARRARSHRNRQAPNPGTPAEGAGRRRVFLSGGRTRAINIVVDIA